MKKKNVTYAGLGLVLAVGLAVAGCGASSDGGAKEMAMETAAYDSAYATNDLYAAGSPQEAVMEEEAVTEENGGSSEVASSQVSERKLIKTVSMEAETEAFDDLLKRVEEKSAALGGYVEADYTYNGSYYYDNTRNASLTLRIPAEKLEDFLSAVAETSNIISKNETVSDVTLQYVDMKSHKEAAQAEQDRLLELMEQAENIEDIIAIESRLSEVRYQIESMESQLRTMDNQVSYSTVYLTITEVEKLTPVEEQSAFERMGTGFMNSVYNIGIGFKNLGIGLVICLPYLIVFAVLVLLILWVVKMINRRNSKRTQQKIQQKEQEKEQIKEQKKEENENE